MTLPNDDNLTSRLFGALWKDQRHFAKSAGAGAYGRGCLSGRRGWEDGVYLLARTGFSLASLVFYVFKILLVWPFFWLLHKEYRICSIKCGPQINAVPVLRSRKHFRHNSLWTLDDGEDSGIEIEWTLFTLGEHCNCINMQTMELITIKKMTFYLSTKTCFCFFFISYVQLSYYCLICKKNIGY